MWRPEGGHLPRYTLVAVIITFTANPSLDRSAPLAGELRLGRLNRLGQVYRIAAGKGVNLGAAIWAAGHPTLAIVPVDKNDPLAEALRTRGLPTRMVPVGRRARTNLSITHPDGTTTRFLEPGEPLTPENQTALVSALLASVPGATWLALCGSLPPGSPVDWYVKLAALARSVGVKVAVDSNGPALNAVVAQGVTPPDLMSPNASELHQVRGFRSAPHWPPETSDPPSRARWSCVTAAFPRCCPRWARTGPCCPARRASGMPFRTPSGPCRSWARVMRPSRGCCWRAPRASARPSASGVRWRTGPRPSSSRARR